MKKVRNAFVAKQEIPTLSDLSQDQAHSQMMRRFENGVSVSDKIVSVIM